MRSISMIIAVVALAVAAPAIAGKGGNGNGGGSTPTTSSITFASVNARMMDGASAAPKINDMVAFATTVEPLAGWEYPMVVTSCYQDVNNDGTTDTNMLGPDIVYSWVDRPDATFQIGAYDSIWKQRVAHGYDATATCRAELDAYGWKGGKESTRVLNATPDWVATG